ncbi:MAG: accessory factor UbiK family protein [Rhodospirillaceae bacterium]|jgi:BMFP domain-containing protein YqiC|nr:accessory factor UbiK family protein [Rhodospirillaceae bacterium]
MMQTRNRFFDDIAKVATSAAGTLTGMKGEIEHIVRHKVESFINSMNLVTREEFEVARAMIAKARENQEKLEKKVKVLESKINNKTTRNTKKETK